MNGINKDAIWPVTIVSCIGMVGGLYLLVQNIDVTIASALVITIVTNFLHLSAVKFNSANLTGLFQTLTGPSNSLNSSGTKVNTTNNASTADTNKVGLGN